MKAVGIKVLKAKLSEYIRLVKAGETVLITERDEVVAELKPANRQRLSNLGWEEILSDWADQGSVVLRAQDPGSWEGPTSKVRLTDEEIRSILDKLREE